MQKWLHNISGVTKNYGHGDIANAAFYQIPSQAVNDRLATLNTLFDDIGSGDIVMSLDGSTDYEGGPTSQWAILLGGEITIKEYVPDYTQSKYMAVGGSTTDDAGGVVIPNTQKIAVSHFRGNGSDPAAYFVLAWDWGGAAEKVLASTRGDISVRLNVTSTDNQLTGDGTKKLSIILINDSVSTSQIIGGAWEAVKI